MKNNTWSVPLAAACDAGLYAVGPDVAAATIEPAPDRARSSELRPTWQVGAPAAGKYAGQNAGVEPKAAGGLRVGGLDANPGKTGEPA